MGSSGKEDGERNESSSRENGALEERNYSTPVFPGGSEEILGRNIPSSSDVSASDYPNSESVGTSVVIPVGSEVSDKGSSVRSYCNEGCESGTLASGFHGVSDNSYSFLPPLSVSKSHRSPAVVERTSTGGNCRDLGLTERLAAILSSPGDGELLFDTDGSRTKLLQFLQALDQQTIGGCRADERLKPLLKLNVSGGAVEDRLLAYLRQNFEAAEVGMLAQCLCAPLASIRVGKVIKQGSRLCPSDIRGHLKLILLPSSDFRLSFLGDDGCEERLALFSCYDENFSIAVEVIPADASGRSFFVKAPNKATSFYWLSEKSMATGTELLEKMKNVLQRKSSLSQLSGICDSRLDSLGEYLHSYLHSTAASFATSTNSTLPLRSYSTRQFENSTSLKHSTRSRHTSSQYTRAQSLHQGSLSLRTSAFKEVPSKTCSSRFGFYRDKAKQRGESHSSFSVGDGHLSGSPPLEDVYLPVSSISGEIANQGDHVETTTTCAPSPLNCPSGPLPTSDSFCSPMISLLTPPLQLFSLPEVQPLNSLSPCYCCCPPCTSTVPYTGPVPHLPFSVADPFTLPPLSSILSSGNSNVLMPFTNTPDVLSKTADFPDTLSDVLVPRRFSVSPLIVPNSTQIPAFTSFISDPIVHIPVIDICSSGQLYLVSAGPSISTTISPLLPNLVSKMIPESEVEKGARETLRMLISSSPSLPEFFTGVDENLLHIHDKKEGALVGGSRGQYSGCFEVDTTLFCSSVSSTNSVPDVHGGDLEASGTDKATWLMDPPEQEEHDDDTGAEQGGEEFR